MADLVTHLCSVLLPAAFVRHRAIGLVAIGSVMPDAFGRVVPMALELGQGVGLPIPDPVVASFGALHAPVGLVVLSGLLAQAFAAGERTTAFRALILGALAHLLLDVLQFHHGRGYPLLAPFSWETYELGVIGSEATVDVALPLLAITALAWTVRTRLRWRGPAPPESTTSR